LKRDHSFFIVIIVWETNLNHSKIDSFKKNQGSFKKNIEIYSVIDYTKDVGKRVKHPYINNK
jgi:hypothetical protein